MALKSEWKGTLVFVAQPVEELAKGAKAMIDDKMYEKAFYFSFRYYAPKENNLPFYNCSLVNHYLTIGGH